MKNSSELIKKPADILGPEAFEAHPIPSSLSTSTYGVEVDDGHDVHLRNYWLAVRKHLWLVIGITALVTMLAAIFMARKPSIYEAQARVKVDLENTTSTLGASNSPVVVNDPAYFNTQIQILSGPGLLRRVVKTLDIERKPGFLEAQSARDRSTWQSLKLMVGLGDEGTSKAQTERGATGATMPQQTSLAPAPASDDLAEAKQLAPYVESLRKNLQIEPVKEIRSPVKETRLIDIRFKHSDPESAAKVVNTIAAVFEQSNLEEKSATNSNAGTFLQKRIAELQGQIRNGEERLINYAQNHQILSLDENQNMVVERLAGLNRQLLDAENDRKVAESAYRAAQSPGAADALAEETNKQINDARSKLAELRQRRAELLVENTEEWYEVKQADQQIAALEKYIQDTRQRATSVVTTNLDTRYRQTLAREQSLRQAFNEQRGETLTQNEAAITYRIIEQEVDTYKKLLEGLLQRSKENDVVLVGMPNNVRVVDYAIAPDAPVGPKRLQGVGLAFALSLGFGILLAIALEYLDDSVRTTEHVESLLHLPALAVIPSAGGLSRRRLLPALSTAQSGNSQNGNNRAELLLNAESRSALAEAYRQLRTSILLSTAGRAPKTLLITSSMPSEGKSTTAVNTALVLAQTGARVLLIDADMRRPRVHDIFDLKNNLGLSTYLSSEMSETRILDMIAQHEPSGLYVLTSGPAPPNPADLLGSDQMRLMLKCVESNFTHVVIDSPPISSFTDSVLISTMVDGVVMVVQYGKSSRSIVRRSQRIMQDVGAKIFGIVLNNARPGSADYHSEYYQQSYYQAERDADNIA